MRNYALFINGIYRKVLDQIIVAQSRDPGLQLYLQPYAAGAVARLRDEPPSRSDPVIMYASITDDLRQVHYTAEVVRWEDKSQIGPHRRKLVERRLRQYQPTEQGLYDASGDGDGPSLNLLTVLKVSRLDSPFSVDRLVKDGDGEPLSMHRSRAGGWSYVLRDPITSSNHPSKTADTQCPTN